MNPELSVQSADPSGNVTLTGSSTLTIDQLTAVVQADNDTVNADTTTLTDYQQMLSNLNDQVTKMTAKVAEAQSKLDADNATLATHQALLDAATQLVADAAQTGAVALAQQPVQVQQAKL